MVIRNPYHPPMGAFSNISHPSRQGLLQVILQILSQHGISEPMWSISSLTIRLGNAAYDLLITHTIGLKILFDNILKSEKVLKSECVYTM